MPKTDPNTNQPTASEERIRDRVRSMLIRYQDEHGYTNYRMSTLVGISFSQYKAIRNGHSGTTLRVLCRIASLVGRPIVID